MNNNSNPISINYSNEKLRVLVEEYITQQRSAFTLKGVCSFVLYWAMEDGKTDKGNLYDSDQMSLVDIKRIKVILEKIAREGRIAATSAGYEKVLN